MSIRSRILPLILILTCLALLPSRLYAQFCPTPLELEVVVLINQERADAGLQPVEVDVRLVEAARLHSDDMATGDFVSHTGSDGSTFSERILAAGYPTPRSENVAAGFATAASLVAGWMGSAGHRANILDNSARHVGVGQAFEANSTYGTYWTSDFGSSSGDPQFPPSCGGGGGGDVVPPVVIVTSPVNGSTVTSTISLAASASDNVGVVGVQFFLDGVPVGPEDTLPPYAIQFDTTTVADGAHALTARARDAAGNQTTSTSVTVTTSNADNGEEPEPALPPTGPGTIDLTIEQSDPGFRVVRAEADAGGVEQLALYIDGQLSATSTGDSLSFDWDVRPLVGSYDVRVDGLEVSGTEVVATTSLFYSVASPDVPSVSLDVVDFRIIGATYIRASADVSDATRLELYVDGVRVLVRDAGQDIEYAWDPAPGTAHQIIFAAYNQTGVAASVTITHVQ